MKTLPTNPSIRKCLRTVEELQNFQDSVMQQLFFHKKISIKEKIEYINCLALARTVLWEEICAAYPEVKGKVASVTTWEISYNDATHKADVPDQPNSSSQDGRKG